MNLLLLMMSVGSLGFAGSFGAETQTAVCTKLSKAGAVLYSGPCEAESSSDLQAWYFSATFPAVSEADPAVLVELTGKLGSAESEPYVSVGSKGRVLLGKNSFFSAGNQSVWLTEQATYIVVSQ